MLLHLLMQGQSYKLFLFFSTVITLSLFYIKYLIHILLLLFSSLNSFFTSYFYYHIKKYHLYINIILIILVIIYTSIHQYYFLFLKFDSFYEQLIRYW